MTRYSYPPRLTFMEVAAAPVKTYKYRFKVDGTVVHQGITTDLERREREHRHRWPDGIIEQVGQPTSHRDAWEWEREQTLPGSNTAV